MLSQIIVNTIEVPRILRKIPLYYGSKPSSKDDSKLGQQQYILCKQVQDLNRQQYSTQAEVDRLTEVVANKDRENLKLWEQLRSAANEYHQEFLAKEAAVSNIAAERDAIRRDAEESIRRQQAFMEVLNLIDIPLVTLFQSTQVVNYALPPHSNHALIWSGFLHQIDTGIRLFFQGWFSS